MKRKKVITAADGISKVKVTINLDSPHGGLTRGEQSALLERIASGVMQTLASVRYLNVELSEIHVH